MPRALRITLPSTTGDLRASAWAYSGPMVYTWLGLGLGLGLGLAYSGPMVYTCTRSAHAVHTQCACSAHAHAVHTQCTCTWTWARARCVHAWRVHGVHTQCTRSAHAVHTQCTRSAHAISPGVHLPLQLGRRHVASRHCRQLSAQRLRLACGVDSSGIGDCRQAPERRRCGVASAFKRRGLPLRQMHGACPGRAGGPLLRWVAA